MSICPGSGSQHPDRRRFVRYRSAHFRICLIGINIGAEDWSLRHRYALTLRNRMGYLIRCRGGSWRLDGRDGCRLLTLYVENFY